VLDTKSPKYLEMAQGHISLSLTAATSSLGRHRKLRLARPQGLGSTSTLDDGLRFARPQGSDSTLTSEDDSASPDPGLGHNLGLRRQSPPRPTQGSDSTSTSEDELRLA
jgi:hypothetical protein